MTSPDTPPGEPAPPEGPPAGARVNLFTWLITGAGVALFLSGGGYWLASRPNPPEIEILAPTPAPVVAHVAGEVVAPGVYTLAPGARVTDALAAAGGPTSRADLDALNRAAPVADGQMVIVPQLPDGNTTTAADASATNVSENGPKFPIDLNTASAAAMQALPGIGEVKAAAIAEWRRQNGPFTSAEQLLAVPGIGPATLDSIRSLVLP